MYFSFSIKTEFTLNHLDFLKNRPNGLELSGKITYIDENVLRLRDNRSLYMANLEEKYLPIIPDDVTQLTVRVPLWIEGEKVTLSSGNHVVGGIYRLPMYREISELFNKSKQKSARF